MVWNGNASYWVAGMCLLSEHWVQGFQSWGHYAGNVGSCVGVREGRKESTKYYLGY